MLSAKLNNNEEKEESLSNEIRILKSEIVANKKEINSAKKLLIAAKKDKDDLKNIEKELESAHKEILLLTDKIEKMTEVMLYKGFDENGIDSEKIEATKTNVEKPKKLTDKDYVYTVQIAVYQNKMTIDKIARPNNTNL